MTVPTKMQPLLLPCPFCGGTATLEECTNESVGISSWTVGCNERDGEIQCMGYQSLTTFARKVEAVEAWNMRDGKPVTLLEAVSDAE